MDVRIPGPAAARWFALVLAVLLTLAPLGSGPLVYAAGPAISVSQNAALSEFPKQLDFHVQAQGTSQIDSVQLAYRVADDPVTTIGTATFAPGFRVDATYVINLQQDYVPPGVTVHYQWLIADQSNATFASPWTDLAVEDRRFVWHTRTQGPVTVDWYSGDDQFASAVLSTATQTLTQNVKNGNAAPVTGVQIVLYGSQQDFTSALGAGTDQWVGGQTFPLYRDVVLLAPPDDLADAQRSVAHEMTHVLLDSTSEDPFGPLPSWLDEGLAMVAEGQPDPVFVQALHDAVGSHSVLSIQSISGNFPEDTGGATLAYAESDSLVSYFLKTYGQQKLATLIAAFRQGATSDEAFQQAIGTSTAEFQSSWEQSLGATPAAPSGASPGLGGIGQALQQLLATLQHLVQKPAS